MIEPQDLAAIQEMFDKANEESVRLERLSSRSNDTFSRQAAQETAKMFAFAQVLELFTEHSAGEFMTGEARVD